MSLIVLTCILTVQIFYTYAWQIKGQAVGENGLRMRIETSSVKSSSQKLSLHTLESKPWKNTPNPLLFLHGSYHSANCWENFLPFFESNGYDVRACSLRGTGPTGMVTGETDRSVAINTHVADLKKVLEAFNVPPIIVAHSFGGLVTMKMLEDAGIRKRVKGVALLCSVPPSGNGPMTGRFIRRDGWAAFKIVRGFVFKAVKKNPDICRDLFFDERVGDGDIKEYMERFEADSKVGIDLGSLKGNLPSDVSMSVSGVASYLEDGPSLAPKRLVLGAERDYIVDSQGVEETATYFGTEARFVETAYHDCMLGPVWPRTAQVIYDWLQTEF